MKSGWLKLAVVMTVIGVLVSLCFMFFLGLIWGMFYEMAVIISIIMAQNIGAIAISWFGDKYPYNNLRWFNLASWGFSSLIIAGLFLLAVVVETMWWWVGTSVSLIAVQIVLFILSMYLVNQYRQS